MSELHRYNFIYVSQIYHVKEKASPPEFRSCIVELMVESILQNIFDSL